ncbi:MFS transporter [Dysosmobacter sp. HCP28S3_G4]|uniref:MFS transporter n=1 Tax=Dysosmobacter sp. HCP28S3_G4 TaxID=3438938 RepID=UPI003F8A404C|nr:MFS transporter [Dysosmobacter sp.]
MSAVKMPSERRVNLACCLMQIGFWGMLGAFAGFQTAVLLDRGFTSGQAGIFIALGYLAGMAAQPLMGSWADRHPEMPLKWLFGMCIVPALALNFLFYFTRPGFWGTALIFLLLGATETNAYPLIDSMAMQYINAGMNISYSLGRGLGAFAYAVVCVVVGQQTARFGVQTALLSHGVLLVLMLAFTLYFPAFPKEALTPKAARQAPHSALYLLRTNKPFTLMLLGCFCGMVAVMPVGSFLVTMIGDLGGDSGDLGLGLFLMAASELPAAFVFQKLYRRFGTEKVLLVSLVFMIAKPLLVLLSGNLVMLLAVQPIQMLGYGLFTPANVYFANENVAPEDRAQGQSLKTVLTNSMGSLTGTLISGLIIDWGGIRAMLVFCIASGCVGLLFGIAAVRARRSAQNAR